MSNDNGNRTREASPAWVTHSYPAGEHPAQPAPEPAPFWSDPVAPVHPVCAYQGCGLASRRGSEYCSTEHRDQDRASFWLGRDGAESEAAR